MGFGPINRTMYELHLDDQVDFRYQSGWLLLNIHATIVPMGMSYQVTDFCSSQGSQLGELMISLGFFFSSLVAWIAHSSIMKASQ